MYVNSVTQAFYNAVTAHCDAYGDFVNAITLVVSYIVL